VDKTQVRDSYNATTMRNPSSNNNFDALRLIAALLVIVGHSFELLAKPDPLQLFLGTESLGGVGVVMFFVMSGYLVTLSLLRTPSLSEFLWRRALRIIPALWVLIAFSVLVWGAVVTRFDLPTYYTSPTTHDYLIAMFFRVRDTLPGTFENNPLQQGFNGSLWTLPLEVRCYLLLALGALFEKRFVRPLLVLLVGLYVAAVFVHFYRGVFRVRAFSLDSYLFIKLVGPFLLGSVIALWGQPRWCNVWIGVALCALLVVWKKTTPETPSVFWLLFVFAVAYLALSLALNTHGALEKITQRGDFSYGLYLYAFPIQQSLIAYFPAISPLILIAATTACAGGCAWLSWRYVESPMLEEKSNLPRWKSWASGLFNRRGAPV
jgi:peptidoglycan/LPS O-acetylase OafA/YrhL